MDLAGKNVVYLGGFGGIGQRSVPELLERQVKTLAIFDLNENLSLLGGWQATYKNVNIFYQKMDITKKTEIEAAYKSTIQRVGHIDLVVNGCGLMNDRSPELCIQINLMGVINSSLIALEHMDKAQGGKGGLIVNFSSVAGLQPTPMVAIYSTAKSGVTTFTRALGNPFYYAHSGVGFITVCPGFTDTPLLDDIANKTTFLYSTPMNDAYAKAKKQSPEECARNLIRVIEQGKNGEVWILDLGEMKQANFSELWHPVLED
ncbi:alcohol dehydrogenase [Scaptodrosophila lebanonensis]|uniref:Fat body protein 2 n=1 Tax=Drosophila lebanonensis TaxID=7225 RepID=A0A6J2UCM4_DROLE|nr:alcohol dehydrogenase [Scaptodrosophila lebanonensis]